MKPSVRQHVYRWGLVGLGSAAALLVANACNSITGASDLEKVECEPGEELACTHSSGCSGRQRCFSDGTGFGLCDCNLGTGGSDNGVGGADNGTGGAYNGVGGSGTISCIPNAIRPCVVAGSDCDGAQTCNLSGSSWSACECDEAGQGGSTGNGGSGSGLGGGGPGTCSPEGFPCTGNSECCPNGVNPGVCAGGTCASGCTSDIDCVNCCSALFDSGTNQFLYRICTTPDICLSVEGTSPPGIACGNDAQCNQQAGDLGVVFCPAELGFCLTTCSATSECAPAASCATSPDGSLCLANCVVDADCAPLNLRCLSLPTVEGTTAFMCADE